MKGDAGGETEDGSLQGALMLLFDGDGGMIIGIYQGREREECCEKLEWHDCVWDDGRC